VALEKDKEIFNVILLPMKEPTLAKVMAKVIEPP